jgi:hypothetical protein
MARLVVVDEYQKKETATILLSAMFAERSD